MLFPTFGHQPMITGYYEKLRAKELHNFRLLNVLSSVIVTTLGFVFEFSFHDGYILSSGLVCSMILTSNYFLSYYSPFYRRHFTNITLASIYLLHFWAVYIAYARNFEISILLPLSISIFTFSLAFGRFVKSLLFIFTISSLLLVMMIAGNSWQSEFTITLAALYAGAFLSHGILKRRSEYHSVIQHQEKRYLSLVENMNDGLVYMNAAGKITYCNERFSLISGLSPASLTTSSGSEIESMLYDGAKKLFENPVEGKSSRSEFRITKLSGENIWVQSVAAPHFDGNAFAGMMIVCTDISKLKNTQEILKKREEGYRSFIEQSAVGIWRAEYVRPISTSLPVADQVELLLDTGKISECNDFMAQMYGYSDSSELIGRRIRDFYHIENNFDDEKTKELLTSFVSNDYRISNAESKERDRNGIIRYMLNNNIGIVEDGYLVRTWGVQTDITERKRTEKELLESNQELDTFFYKASHDLKGPLASVMGIVNLARLESADKTIGKYFDMIETSVRRLDRTLHDLIEIARSRRGSNKLSNINLNSLVDEILNSLRHSPGFDRIKFNIDINPLEEIMADKVLMLSVFQNLIHNAINYCNPYNPEVSIRIDATENGIELEVCDNGKGIPEAIRDRVFDMFYRGNPESAGSGLGLYIVKSALEKMNGTITIENKPGAAFIVRIPDAVTEKKLA